MFLDWNGNGELDRLDVRTPEPSPKDRGTVLVSCFPLFRQLFETEPTTDFEIPVSLLIWRIERPAFLNSCI